MVKVKVVFEVSKGIAVSIDVVDPAEFTAEEEDRAEALARDILRQTPIERIVLKFAECYVEE